MPDTRPRRDQHGKPNNAFSVDPRIIKEASDSLGPRINEFSTKMAHESRKRLRIREFGRP
jgi:hypothetical protein